MKTKLISLLFILVLIGCSKDKEEDFPSFRNKEDLYHLEAEFVHSDPVIRFLLQLDGYCQITLEKETKTYKYYAEDEFILVKDYSAVHSYHPSSCSENWCGFYRPDENSIEIGKSYILERVE